MFPGRTVSRTPKRGTPPFFLEGMGGQNLRPALLFRSAHFPFDGRMHVPTAIDYKVSPFILVVVAVMAGEIVCECCDT